MKAMIEPPTKLKAPSNQALQPTAAHSASFDRAAVGAGG